MTAGRKGEARQARSANLRVLESLVQPDISYDDPRARWAAAATLRAIEQWCSTAHPTDARAVMESLSQVREALRAREARRLALIARARTRVRSPDPINPERNSLLEVATPASDITYATRRRKR